MAHPFMPMRESKLRKLSREREDSDFGDTDSNCSPRFESPVPDSHRESSLIPALSTKTSTENIISQP
jgi:hypothetical protein